MSCPRPRTETELRTLLAGILALRLWPAIADAERWQELRREAAEAVGIDPTCPEDTDA